MSVKVMSWVWDNSTSRGIDRLVLLAIADAANDDGRDAWPSISTLSKKACVDSRTVQRSIRRLTEMGELRVVNNAGMNGVNVYHLIMTPGTLPPRQNATPAERHPGRTPPRQNAGVAESPKGGGTAPPKPSFTRPLSNKQSARGTRLPDDWQPTPDLVEYVRKNCPDIDGRKVTEDFRDYWHAKAGKEALKVDWSATFRRWVRTEQERAPRNRNFKNTRPTTDDKVRGHLALAQRLAQREADEQQTRLEITQ